MIIKSTRSGKAMSVPLGLGISLAAEIILTITAISIISILVHQNKLAWNSIGYGIMITLLITSFLGSKVAIATVKRQYLLISIMSGVLYWSFLLCVTALFFGGNFSSIIETAILIISGSITAVLLRKQKRKHVSLEKYKIRNC